MAELEYRRFDYERAEACLRDADQLMAKSERTGTNKTPL